MRKLIFLFSLFLLMSNGLKSQTSGSYELSAGLSFQKTHKLYWENGVTADFSHGILFNRRLHLKATVLSSRLGSAIASNAIKQEQYLVGADWRFLSKKPLQLLTGFNIGYFTADYEIPIFNDLTSRSALAQLETGLIYYFEFPLSLSASLGYNFISGNGEKGAGSLFPLFYGAKISYRIK